MKIKERSVSLFRITAAVLTLAMLAIIFTAIVDIGRDSGKESLLHMEKAVKRAALACYATEGVYPPNVQYMKEHYGLQIDESRYTVHYSVFAENLMPEITVLERSR